MYDFDEISVRIQDYAVHREIPVPRWRGAREPEQFAFRANVLRAIRELAIQVDERDLQDVATEVSKRIVGLGVLHPYLEQDNIEEIIVRNGYVTVERDGSLEPVGFLGTDQYFYRLARRIADMEGKGLGAAEPMIKVGLPDGSRFAATIPPLSREGTAIMSIVIVRLASPVPAMLAFEAAGGRCGSYSSGRISLSALLTSSSAT